MELLNIEGTRKLCLRHFDAVTTTTQCLRPAPLPQPIGLHSITLRTNRKEKKQKMSSRMQVSGVL